MVIGLTGQIAAGKSYILSKLKSFGANVLDCDKLVFELNKKGAPLYLAIKKEFGQSILDENGELKKTYLKHLILKDETYKKRLNDISYDIVYNSILKEIDKYQGILFVEGVRIFEFSSLFDRLWYVECDKDIRIERLIKRDSLKKEEALKIIDGQKDLIEAKKYAHAIIDSNRPDLDEFLERLYEDVKKEC